MEILWNFRYTKKYYCIVSFWLSSWGRWSIRPISAPWALYLTGSMAAFAEDGNEFLREAQTYYEKGEISAAIIQLKNALRQDPNNAHARRRGTNAPGSSQ